MTEPTSRRVPRLAFPGASRRPTAAGAAVALLVVSLFLLTGGPGRGAVVAPPTAPASAPAPTHPVSAIAGPMSGSSSWHNVTATVGTAPSGRSLAQAAYSPALNATILFGGYNGAGGNFALGDTWQFSDNRWTELFPAVSPAPRWGATMVYDPELQALVLFGGRNDTAFFSDTWEYNATGWHRLAPKTAPSPRYDYGMVFDGAIDKIVLYGGGRGNNPAGTFTGFVFFNDTWTFADGQWTNVTASSGPAPVGRLIRGQMAYDAADGYIVMTGGYTYVAPGGTAPCGFVRFAAAWAETWKYGDGRWTELAPVGRTPPPGVGSIWFDAEANATLYYEGMQNGSAGECQVSGNEVWSFSAGNWTLVTEANISAPPARFLAAFVDDEGEHQQLMFGGELVNSSSEEYGVYAHDTWTYAPTWVSFVPGPGAPGGADWRVTLGSTVRDSTRGPLLFVVAPGSYDYSYAVLDSGGGTLGSGYGGITVVYRPASVELAFPSPPSPPSPASGAFAGAPALYATLGAALGGGVAAGVVLVGYWRQRSRLRREGERLVDRMEDEDRFER